MCLFGIPLSVKTLNIFDFRKKIKSLLLNVLGNEDNYLNVNYLIEYFMKLPDMFYIPPVVILVVFKKQNPLSLNLYVRGFFLYVIVFLFFFLM